MRRLLLASQGLAALPAFLAGAGPSAVFVPTAANGLGDEAIVDGYRALLGRFGLVVRDLDLDEQDADCAGALAPADVVVVGGGNPFRLLARLRATGADRVLAERVAAGLPYVGISAGAMVAGPTLEPVAMTSPFAPEPGQPLPGLGLTDVLVLPHDDRPGRAERNAAAVRAHPNLRAIPLADGQAVLVEGERVELVPSAVL